VEITAFVGKRKKRRRTRSGRGKNRDGTARKPREKDNQKGSTRGERALVFWGDLIRLKGVANNREVPITKKKFKERTYSQSSSIKEITESEMEEWLR